MADQPALPFSPEVVEEAVRHAVVVTRTQPEGFDAAAEVAYAAGRADAATRVIAALRGQQGANDSDWRNGWNCALESAAQSFERGEHLGD